MMKLKEILTYEGLVEQAIVQRDKKSRAGIDGMSGKDALLWMQINGKRLLEEIMKGRYEPVPAACFTTAKATGSYRTLSVLTVTDRIVQSCIMERVSETCETFFLDSSFAYRPGKGIGSALQKYTVMAEQYEYAGRIDPVSCFDNIDHAILQRVISDYLHPDKALSSLLQKYLRQPIIVDERVEQREKGLLQGAPLSPVQCNLYFHPLDLWMTDQKIPFIRYADDIAIFSDSLLGLNERFSIISNYFLTKLNLVVNESKSITGKSADDIQFLGHRFQKDKKGIIALSCTENAEEAYYSWHERNLTHSHRKVDILSDGVLRQKDFSMIFESTVSSDNIPVAAVDMINIYSSVIFDTGV